MDTFFFLFVGELIAFSSKTVMKREDTVSLLFGIQDDDDGGSSTREEIEDSKIPMSFDGIHQVEEEDSEEEEEEEEGKRTDFKNSTSLAQPPPHMQQQEQQEQPGDAAEQQEQDGEEGEEGEDLSHLEGLSDDKLGTMLLDAALSDDLTAVLQCIKINQSNIKNNTSNTNVVDWCDPEDDCTPLQLAALSGSSRIIRVLLDHGANVNLKDNHGTLMTFE